jgi:hypothetical protein
MAEEEGPFPSSCLERSSPFEERGSRTQLPPAPSAKPPFGGAQCQHLLRTLRPVLAEQLSGFVYLPEAPCATSSRSADLEVISVPGKSIDDEHVEYDDHNRQHRRHRDVEEPPHDPQGGEGVPYDPSERPAA